MANIEMVIDSIRVSLMNYQRVVILREKEGERYLPCWIGPAEADAIAVTMQGVYVPRPLTHDLVCTIARALGGTVKYVIINELKNDTFYAKTAFDRGDQQMEIDCRPSDALAVAVRTAVPIFVDEKVLKKAGIFLDPETGKPLESASERAVAFGEKTDRGRLEIFSESAQDILSLAENEAKQVGQSFIGTGHVLLALVKKSPTTASEVLKRLDVDQAKLQVEVTSHINQPSNVESDEGGLSSAVKKTIELSITEAKRLGSWKVQPEHILLGLVRQKDGIATDLLKNLQVSPERIYIELIWLYTHPGYEQQPPSR